MSRKIGVQTVAVLAAVSLALTACGGGDDGDDTGQGAAKKGGTYRLQTKTYRWTNAFDPTGEYLGAAWGIYSNLLIRTLMGYKHVTASKGGNDLIPDLATDTGQVSADGLTYTFKIKKGVTFGPPINREITTADIKYAFERIGTKSLVAQYGFYYEPAIEGLTEFKDGKAKEITGVQTPDAETIIFTLKKPVGDFKYLLAMPASGPIPEEVGKCFDKAGEYGRYVISTAGYMIEGIDKIDTSTCAKLKKTPASGFDPTNHLKIVRRPNYDAEFAATENKDARENFIDAWDLSLNSNVDDIFQKIQLGELDGEYASAPAGTIKEYNEDPALKPFLKVNPGDRTWYFTMNLTEPPFDDLAVRRAVNFAIDKAALLQAAGGPPTGEIATHAIPPEMLGGRLAAKDYDPYKTPDFRGDVAKAKEEMKKSKYDTDKDGDCDESAACKKVFHLTEDAPPFSDYIPTLEAALTSIGMTVDSRAIADSYPTASDVSKKVPIFGGGGWGKDYADAYTFAVLFDSRAILATGNYNYSLVGITNSQATEFKASFPAGGVPSADAKIDECVGKLGEERLDCWADFDKLITEQIVPWIPYRWATNVDIVAPSVTRYEFDQFSGEAGFAHMAVDTTKQK